MMALPPETRAGRFVRRMIGSIAVAVIIATGLASMAGCTLRKATTARAGPEWSPMKIAEFGIGKVGLSYGEFSFDAGGTTLTIWWPYEYEWFDPIGSLESTNANSKSEGGETTAERESTVPPD